MLFFTGKLDLPEALKADMLQQMEENPFLKLSQKFKTYYHIDKHVRSSPAFKFVEPQEIKLPDAKRTFSYVSVIDTLATLASDPSFKADACSDSGFLRDVKDGTAYKENAFFKKNPEAFTLIFYSDAVELCNPLGARKGAHKVVNGYFTVAELPKHLRSKAENLFLAFSVKEKDVKEYPYEVYQPLIQDLAKLEKGVDIGGKIIKV
jgi:hypothetical protein